MRVAYVCTDPGIPIFGSKGASVHAQSVLRALLARGAEVDLLTPRPGARAAEGLSGVRVHLLPSVRGGTTAEREQAARDSDANVAKVLGRLHVEGPLDLVYERYALWGRTATAWAARAGVRSVLEVNAPLIDEQATHRELVGRAAAEQVAVAALSAASAVACVSDEVAVWARRRSACADRVHVVPNGVDVGRITPSTRPVATAEDGPLTLGFVGTLKPWHGVGTLLDALALLDVEAPGAHRLLLVGDGPQAPLLRRRAADLGVSHLVELTGAISPVDVPTMLHRMDAAVAPYPALERFYFSPLKVYEYLAAGLPIVASRIGQVVAALDDGRLGVLVEPGSSADLAAALSDLGADPERRRALGQAARAAAVERHGWDGVVDRVLSLVSPVTA